MVPISQFKNFAAFAQYQYPDSRDLNEKEQPANPLMELSLKYGILLLDDTTEDSQMKLKLGHLPSTRLWGLKENQLMFKTGFLLLCSCRGISTAVNKWVPCENTTSNNELGVTLHRE